MPVCGGCTACCSVPKIPELKKPKGQPCIFCSGIGCSIYTRRPNQCREFECAWIQSEASADLRPDRCGILFERMDEDVFWGTLLPGRKISPVVGAQIEAFLNQGFAVIVHKMDINKFMFRDGSNRAKILIEREIRKLIRKRKWQPMGQT